MYNFENIEKNVFEFAKEIDNAILFYEEFANKFILNKTESVEEEKVAQVEEEKVAQVEEEKVAQVEEDNFFNPGLALTILNGNLIMYKTRFNILEKSLFKYENGLIYYINKGKSNENRHKQIDFPQNIINYVNFMRNYIIEIRNRPSIQNMQSSSRSDEIIENINDYNRIVLPNKIINKIKQTRYERIGNDRKKMNGDSCCICMDEYKNDDHVLLLTCSHVIHYKCGCDVFQKTTHCCMICRKEIGDGVKKGTLKIKNQEPLKSRYE